MPQSIRAFRDRVRVLYGDLIDSREEHESDLRNAIAECRVVLTSQDGHLGKWEASELEYAERLAAARFLLAAAAGILKAIEVSQLPKEEYEEGYNYIGFVRLQD